MKSIMKPIQKITYIALTLVAALALSACGGSSDGGGINTPPSVNHLTVSPASVIVASDGTTSTPKQLTLTLSDGNGNPVSGTVSFGVPSFVTVNGKNKPVTIGASGTAQVTVQPKTTGKGNITTHFVDGSGQGNGPTVKVTSTVTNSSGGNGNSGGGNIPTPSLPTLSAISLNPGPLVTNSSSATASVTLRDANGTPMAGEIVNFSLTGPCADCGQISPASGSILTDSSGKATIQVATGAAVGANELTASYSAAGGQNIATTINFMANEAASGGGTTTPSTSTMSAIAFSPSSTHKVTKANPGTASVVLKDKNGNPLEFAVVNFTATNGVLDPSNGKVLTDASGKAEIAVLAGTTKGGGTLTATYTEAGGSSLKQQTGFTSEGDGGTTSTGGNSLSGLKILVGGSPVSGSNMISQAAPGAVTVTLEDSQGQPLANKLVTFGTTVGSLDPSSGQIQTNASGQASINLTAGSGGQSAGILTATYTDSQSNTVSASTAFTTKGDAAQGSNSAISLTNMAITVNSSPVGATNPIKDGATNEATVKLLDSNGSPMANEVVVFSSSVASVSLSPTTGAVLTDSSGVATVNLAAGDVETAGVLTAKYNTANGGVVQTQLGFKTDGDATSTSSGASLTGMAVTYSVANSISAGNPATVDVILKDASGSPLQGEVVTFSSTAGVMDPSTGSVLTDTNGKATLALLAGSVKTAGTVTATYNDGGTAVTQSVGFQTDGDAGAAGGSNASITLALAPVQINAATPGTATVTLKDSNGNVLPNKVVNVTTTAGNLTPASGKVLTDATGEATIQLLDNGVKTAGILKVTYDDGNGNVASDQTGFQLAGDGSAGGATKPQLTVIGITDGSSNPIGTNGSPIASGNPGTVTVKLMEADGTTAVEGAVIDFSLSSSVGVLTSQSALTDASGVATVTLQAGTVQGAGTIIASYQYTNGSGSQTVTQQQNFAVNVSSAVGAPQLTTPDLKDSSNAPVGTIADPISDTRPATVTVTLTDANNAPLDNKLITFSLLSGVGQLDPATGTALTDGNGKATLTLKTGAQQGAGTLKATYTDGANTATSQINFTTKGAGQTVSEDLALGSGDSGGFDANLTAPASPVTGSSYAITVSVVDVNNGNALYTDSPIAVTLTSVCAQGGNATIEPATSNSIGGHVVVSYKPTNNCTQDNIQASATVNGNTLSTNTGTFSITQSPANSISFLQADPDVIGIKGASAAGVEVSSTLSFQVTDQSGHAVGAGKSINFTVQNPTGGFAIAGAATATTDANGQVSVIVNSGTVPGVGTVKAALATDPSVYGTGSVSIQQGVPTEDRFSIAVETLNPAAGNHLGKADNVTVRAADRYGNWVPDGTQINFATKLGDIGGSCTTIKGACSVTWTSQGPQQINFDKDRTSRACLSGTPTEWERNGLPGVPPLLACGEHDFYGVNVITAWTTGEESFGDLNGDNVFGSSESYVDLPEMFQDFNLTGEYEAPDANFQPGEQYQDKNKDGAFTVANGKYNGLSCTQAAISAGDCENTLVDVRAAATMVLSTDAVQMQVAVGGITGVQVTAPTQWGDAVLQVTPTPSPTPSVVTGTSGTITVVVADMNGNAPPVGTTVTATIQPTPAQSKILGPTSCKITNTLSPVICQFNYLALLAGERLVFTAKSPGGPSTSSNVEVQ